MSELISGLCPTISQLHNKISQIHLASFFPFFRKAYELSMVLKIFNKGKKYQEYFLICENYRKLKILGSESLLRHKYAHLFCDFVTALVLNTELEGDDNTTWHTESKLLGAGW